MEVINLNLIPSGALPVVHASQYDEGRTFRANLMDGSTVYTLDGTEVLECDVKKPDGNIVTVAVTNTSDSYVEIDTTLQMCACAGESLAELHITKGAQEIGTLNFILAVERSPLEGGIQSDSGIHNLQTQIGEAVAEQYAAEDVVFDAAPVAGHGTGFAVTSEGVKTYVEGEIAALTIPEELDDLQDVEITSPTAGQIIEYDDNDGKWKNVANPASTTNFGAPYDENTTYNVPSLVIYNNLLYKLNDGEDGTTGPWDPTKWTQTSVAELAQLIGSLSTLTTTDKSSIVGAVNEVNAGLTNTYTKSEIDGVQNAIVNSTYATGNLYFKRFGKMVIVFGMITLTDNVSTNNQIFSGLPLNNNGGNNVIKAINNDGTSADWVIYCPNNNNVYLSASSQPSGKSYTISFAYYVNA